MNSNSCIFRKKVPGAAAPDKNPVRKLLMQPWTFHVCQRSL